MKKIICLLLFFPILSCNNQEYRDLNKNGKLDVYEDKTQSIDDRVSDLISKMTLREKAGSMFIHIAFVGENGEMVESPVEGNFFSAAVPKMSTMLNELNMNHFNIFNVVTKENMLKWGNMIQKVGENSRLFFFASIPQDNPIGPAPIIIKSFII